MCEASFMQIWSCRDPRTIYLCNSILRIFFRNDSRKNLSPSSLWNDLIIQELLLCIYSRLNIEIPSNEFSGLEMNNDFGLNIDKREKMNIPKRNIYLQKVLTITLRYYLLFHIVQNSYSLCVVRVGLTRELSTIHH